MLPRARWGQRGGSRVAAYPSAPADCDRVFLRAAAWVCGPAGGLLVLGSANVDGR